MHTSSVNYLHIMLMIFNSLLKSTIQQKCGLLFQMHPNKLILEMILKRGVEHLSHMGRSTRSVMSEELYKKYGAVKALDAECVCMRQIMEACLAPASAF